MPNNIRINIHIEACAVIKAKSHLHCAKVENTHLLFIPCDGN